jgi:hypothetical protein
MKATIYVVDKLTGKESYVAETSADDRLVLSIYARNTLATHLRSIAKSLRYEYWEIDFGGNHHKSIPKSVNAIAFCYKKRASSRKGNQVTYYFHIEYPKNT